MEAERNYWTEHTAKCQGCGRTFRISEEAIRDAYWSNVRAFGKEEAGTREDAVNAIEWWLECVTGEAVEGEIVEGEGGTS
jgi:hypothetical protein